MTSSDSHKAIITTLNGLIETNRDGEKGFTDAARHAHAPELRTLMSRYAGDCARNIRELQACVVEHGGKAETGGTTIGALHRGWINLKASLSNDDDLMLLEECERGEDHAKAQYLKAIEEPLSSNVRTLLLGQRATTEVHHDHIRDLRNRGRAAAAAADAS